MFDINTILSFITAHPYAGMFLLLVVSGLGLPISEELVVIAVGVVVARGGADPILAGLTCYCGVLIADSIAIYIGWHFGKAVLHRRWFKRLVHPRRLMWARHQVQEHGAWMIVFSRFVMGIRWPVLLISGMMRLARWKFFLAEGPALAVTISIQLCIGWLLSKSLDVLKENLGEITGGFVAVGLVMIVVYLVIHRRLKARRAARAAAARLAATRTAAAKSKSPAPQPMVAGRL